MKIEKIETSKKILIVAEIGNNHEGSLKNAKKLILLAKKSGVDAVKFQTYKTEQFVSKKNLKRFNQLKKFELKESNFIELKNFTKKNGLLFISTPFDLDSAKLLCKICDIVKIASSDNNYLELIDTVCLSSKPIIISTGLLELEEIVRLYSYIINKHGKKIKKRLAFLHCITSYPAKNEDLNLNFIKILKKKIDCSIGFSDHSKGPIASILSASLGAEIIEKHFTMSKKFSKFRDHALSADANEMEFIVKNTKNIISMMGHEREKIKKNEKKNLIIVRRSIFANKFIEKNKKIERSDLKIVRPGNGLGPENMKKIIGKVSKKNIKEDSLIYLNYIFDK